jgi:hypothetical protein
VVCLVPNGLVQGDRGVLRVGQEDERQHEQRGGQDDRRRPTREARPEQVRRGEPQRRCRVGALSPDELLGLASFIGWRLHDGVARCSARYRTGVVRERRRERKGARDSVAQVTFGVDRNGSLTEPRARDGGQPDEDHEADDRDRDRKDRQDLDRQQAAEREQRDLGDGHGSRDEPRPAYDPPQPQPPKVRPKVGPNRLEDWIDRGRTQRARIRRRRSDGRRRRRTTH